MKTVLCYGDSLTFGTNPEGGRHDYENRWPTVLGKGLDDTLIIAEGLGGRTTVFDDFSAVADRNGAKLLPAMLASHSPLDCVVVMLGTNDLKPFICGDALGAAMGVKRLIEIIRTYPYAEDNGIPKIVLVAPPFAVKTENLMMAAMFGGRIEESHLFVKYYTAIAEEMDCDFFNAASVAAASPLDGVHLDAENTRAIGEALVPVVNEVLES
ncbi:MAG: SGNH/GDSL hydrolase family protein [Rhizobiaceae bacterium]